MFGWGALSLTLGLAVVGGPTVGALGAGAMVQAQQQLGRDAFVTGSPGCPRKAKFCFEIALHVVAEEDKDVATPRWFSAQVREANRLFAPISVGFFVGSVATSDAEFADLRTRKQRDLLGRDDHSFGVIHVFAVRRLADVDVEGAIIRGVHWRDRAETSRRWIILSSIASPMVFAHEAGHFFGLPHSSYRTSLMNKSPHRDPPWSERTFVPQELEIMERRRDEMVADKTLRKHRRGKAIKRVSQLRPARRRAR